MSTEKNDSERQWIKVGDDPLRHEYGRESDSPFLPQVKDQLAYVEEEKYSSYFQWETYTNPREKGSAPDIEQAQEEAETALREHDKLG